MLKNDKWIAEMAEKGMIAPFEKSLINQITVRNGPVLSPVMALSYGLSSYGYDIRLSPNEFKIFRHVPGQVVDPKDFNLDHLESVPLQSDKHGQFFILPAHSYGLGFALEKLDLPNDVSVICLGKSSYARIGLIANVTPAEAGWHGHLTLEFSNSSGADQRIYANEGIVQLLFLGGEPCETSYAERKGKYQNQQSEITYAKV